MTTVITYGTFDLFHVGHIAILERSRDLGDKLFVGVSSDEFNAIKGKQAFFSYADRSRIVSAMKCVDGVFPEDHWSQKRADIQKYGADILVMGDDWQGKFDDLSDLCKVEYLPRTTGISTTHIRTTLSRINPEMIDNLKGALDSLNQVIKSLE